MLGGGNKIVEADETYWGNSKRSKAGKAARARGARGGDHKEKNVALVERNGNVRSFHVPKVNGATLKAVLLNNIAPDSHLMTDDYRTYRSIGRKFSSHQTVNHSAGEYARGIAHTNTIEGYFSLLKRGLIGTFHHVGAQHLHRYTKEFDFRYNNRKITDVERSVLALQGIGGKRLYYRHT